MGSHQSLDLVSVSEVPVLSGLQTKPAPGMKHMEIHKENVFPGNHTDFLHPFGV